MHIRTRFLKVLTATVVAVVLAGVATAAQSVRGASVQAGATIVGTLKISTISETPTPVFALSFSVTNVGDTSSGGGGGAGKAVFADFSVARQPDAASPAIFRAAATGQHLAKVQIDVYHPGGVNIDSTYILTDVLVSSFGTDASFERVSFSYSRIEIISGGASTCYDREAAKIC